MGSSMGSNPTQIEAVERNLCCRGRLTRPIATKRQATTRPAGRHDRKAIHPRTVNRTGSGWVASYPNRVGSEGRR